MAKGCRDVKSCANIHDSVLNSERRWTENHTILFNTVRWDFGKSNTVFSIMLITGICVLPKVFS